MSRATARKTFRSYLEKPAVRLFTGLGISPNVVTLLGLLIAGVSAYLLSEGYLLAGGGALLVAGVFDLFDGAVARATGKASRGGALVDSVADRVSEAIVLLGMLLFYLDQSSTTGPILVFLTLVGSVMVSYVRARAEGLGIDCKVGLMTRPEHVLILGIGSIVGQWWLTSLTVALGVVAALALFTSAHRVFHVLRSLKTE